MHIEPSDTTDALPTQTKEEPVSSQNSPFVLSPISSANGVFQAGIQLGADLNNAQAPIVANLKILLKELAGKKFESLDDKRLIVSVISELLQRTDLRAQCPRCRKAALLRCQKSGNSKSGMFQIYHPNYKGKRNIIHKSQSTFPEIRLIPAPQDPRRKFTVNLPN